MTTDILIPLGTGSKFDNIELRFCLRSIEKHLTGVANIYIIGECPEWVKNIIHIPCEDIPGVVNRAHNIYRKIITGINFIDDLRIDEGSVDFIKKEMTVSCITLSNNFHSLNDDHFLLTDFEAGQFPYLHRGEILTWRIGNEQQTRQMENTVKELGGSPLDFDIHCPIVYNKVLFRAIFEGMEWPEYGYGIKSYYCNQALKACQIKETAFCEDLKFSEPLSKRNIYKALEGREWFSVSDKTLRLGEMQDVLQELYPKKSIYEL